MNALQITEVILGAAVASGTPILFAGLGELITEKSGVLNLGVEGMMLVGAFTGFIVSHNSQNVWLGAASAAVVTALFSLCHSIPGIYLRVGQVVSGLAVVILGTGIASAFGRTMIGQVAPSFSDFSIPILSDIPFLGSIFFCHDPLVYLSFISIPLLWFFINYTRVGLQLQVCGENPRLADTSGVSVSKYRLIASTFGAAFVGLGGAYLSLADTPSWVDGMTAGRGWIAVAMVIFAGWSPWRLALGAWLFGGLVAIQFRIQAFGFDAPIYLLKMLPYVFTLVVLLFATRGRWKDAFGAPTALGIPFFREQR